MLQMPQGTRLRLLARPYSGKPELWRVLIPPVDVGCVVELGESSARSYGIVVFFVTNQAAQVIMRSGREAG
jgi:hypothetical protein